MIAAGDEEFTIPVIIKDDTDFEGNQTFEVTLSNIRKAVFTGNPSPVELTQTITIVDNEEPTLSLAKTEISVAEDVNGGEIELTFELTGLYADSTGDNADLEITYSIETTGTEATEGVDFDTGFAAGTSGTATIAAGELSKAITIDITDDALFEGNETFKVKVADEPGDSTDGFVVFEKDGVTVTELVADITIIDDEVPTLMVDSYSNVGEDDGQITIGFTLSGPRATDVVFEYNTEIDPNNDSRADQADFVGQFSKSATISANSTTTSISIGIIDDDNRENNEEFKLVLSNLVDAKFVDNTATTQDLGITIEDDEMVPTLTITNATTNTDVTGNATSIMEDAGSLVLDLVLTGDPSDEIISFNYETADGTGTNVIAVAGEDYTAQSSTSEMIMSGESDRIVIPILSDTKFEENENFKVTLSNLQNATFGAGIDGVNEGLITVTITNDDGEPTMTIENGATALSFSEGIGSATFNVVLSNPTYKTVTANVATSFTGNADSAETEDYTNPGATLTFNPGPSGTAGSTGSISETITIPISNDSIYEKNEVFTVTVSGVANATFGNDHTNNAIQNLPVTVTILEDDVRSELTADVTLNGDGVLTVAEESGPLSFNLLLSKATTEDTVVMYSTSTGTAKSPADYTAPASNATATIRAGQTTINDQTGTATPIMIPIINDDFTEGNEIFYVTLEIQNKTTAFAHIDQFPDQIVIPVSITDNDTTDPTVYLADNSSQPTPTEASGGNFTIPFELSHASSETVSVTYTITTTPSSDATNAGSTASTQGVDFIAPATGIVTITSGTTGSISIPIVDDNIAEGGEVFTVRLSSPNNATLGSKVDHEYTITDNDSAMISLTGTYHYKHNS